MFSSNTEFGRLLIPLEDIVSATNNFADKNLLKGGGKAEYIYKGVLLLRSGVAIDVVIRKYSSTITSEFYKEIWRIYQVKHRNVVSLIGFCDEEGEKLIIMEHVMNGNLHKYISDPVTLTWSQRLHICSGAAAALKHCILNLETNDDIKHGYKILLDKDWEAKVLVNYNESAIEISDAYSFGLVLLEVLYGRKVTISDVNQYVAKMEENHHKEDKQLDDMIDPNLRTQMNPLSLSIFSEAAYHCLKKQITYEHIMHQIERRLKAAFDVQWKHENNLQMENYAHLKIPLRQIMLATDNFNDTYLIKSISLDEVFKTELGHFKGGSLSTIEGGTISELPKKKVIIRRDCYHDKMLKDFFAEIDMLSSCSHPNLLTLLGFCDEDLEMILVFECDFKETLHDYLRSERNRTNLIWEQRIRLSLNIAHVLKYLHNMEQSQVMQSVLIFFDENMTIKIGNFRLFEFSSYEHWPWEAMVIYTLGVTLFDILTWRLEADGPSYTEKNSNYLALVARKHHEKGKLKEIIDPTIMQENQECSYTFRKGPNQDSLDTYSKIAYQCLVETPSGRPTLEVVIESLEKTLHFQVQNLEHLKIALKDIHMATENFDETYCIGSGGYGKVYKCSLKIKTKSKDGLLETANRTVAVKRIYRTGDGLGKEGFFAEIDMLSRCEHPNIVSLLGFCAEDNEMLLVYEHASNGSLNDYLGGTNKIINLTWKQRLNMCLGIANGLNYLHTTMDGRRIIHRDIKSDNILLGKNWEAKIADFGLSKFHSVNQQASTVNTMHVAGTSVYLDPEYGRTGRLKKASDIYSFGVVLFEIFSGTLAYDSSYTLQHEKGLAPIVRRHFKKETLKEILDKKIMDEAVELGFTGKVRPDQDSLDAFLRIAYQCIAKTQASRPTIEVIIKQLEKALYFQENSTLKISLEHIKLGTENFSDEKCIMRGGYGKLYKGKFQYDNSHKKVVIKRFSQDRQLNNNIFSREHAFLNEFEVLIKHKHENIVGLEGYCNEMDENIIVYEHVSKGSLDKYLNDTSFSWTKRLKICIDIANGLKFLHQYRRGLNQVIHRDLKSSSILLTKDWRAKISGFEFSLTYPSKQKYVFNNVEGSPGYCDPLYQEAGSLTLESDIYSFGVILLEILSGRLACPENCSDNSQFLGNLVKRQLEGGAHIDEMVFEGIKDQIAQESLFRFCEIAFNCLHDDRNLRPTATYVVVELQTALGDQMIYRLPKTIKMQRNYKEIIHFSKSSTISSTMAKKYIYDIVSKGILNEDDKLEIIQVLQQPTRDHKKSIQLMRKKVDDYN